MHCGDEGGVWHNEANWVCDRRYAGGVELPMGSIALVGSVSDLDAQGVSGYSGVGQNNENSE
jgi:hypothetical protein